MRERITIEGARRSYRQNCESMQRVHVSPAIGKRKVASVTTRDVERLASAMLAKGASPKKVFHKEGYVALTANPSAVSSRIGGHGGAVSV